jgi:DNA-binding MarR family transcriptional regulator
MTKPEILALERRILDTLRTHHEMSMPALAQYLDTDTSTVRGPLDRLVRRRLLERRRELHPVVAESQRRRHMWVYAVPASPDPVLRPGCVRVTDA